ncbi:hypothetical protein ACJX0J_031329, partial [Zea mays]
FMHILLFNLINCVQSMVYIWIILQDGEYILHTMTEPLCDELKMNQYRLSVDLDVFSLLSGQSVLHLLLVFKTLKICILVATIWLTATIPSCKESTERDKLNKTNKRGFPFTLLDVSIYMDWSHHPGGGGGGGGFILDLRKKKSQSGAYVTVAILNKETGDAALLFASCDRISNVRSGSSRVRSLYFDLQWQPLTLFAFSIKNMNGKAYDKWINKFCSLVVWHSNKGSTGILT